MMTFFLCLIIIANAIVLNSSVDNDITIIDYENNNDGLGNSNFKYRLTDGSTREESVNIINKDTENEYPVIQGMYTFITNSVEYRVRYVADINGFRPQIEMVEILKDRIPTSAFAALAGGAIATLQGGGIG